MGRVTAEVVALVKALKQKGLSNIMISENLKLNGFNIGRSTVSDILINKRNYLQPVKKTTRGVTFNKVVTLSQQINPPTSKEIAKICGVSTQNVHRILNDFRKQSDKGMSDPQSSNDVEKSVGKEVEDEPADQMDLYDHDVDTPETLDDQQTKVCLLCLSFCSKIKDKMISFLLEQLMCVSVEDLQIKYDGLMEEEFMENISLCRTCIAFVKDAERIYTEWKILKEKIQGIQKQVTSKIQQSELSQDLFEGNNVLFQLYERIRSNIHSRKWKTVLETTNTASFYDLGMDIPEFDSNNEEPLTNSCTETDEFDIEGKVKIEIVVEEEEPDLDFSGGIESISGCESDQEEDLASAKSPKLDEPLSDSDDWVPSDDSVNDKPYYPGKAGFRSEKRVRSHRKQRRPKRKRPPKKTSGDGYKKRNVKLFIKCTLCQEEFIDKPAVTEHFRTEHKTNCKFLRQEIIKLEGVTSYVSEYGVDESQPELPVPPSFACPVEYCSETFPTKRDCQAHAKTIHKYKKRYKCDLCDYHTTQQHRIFDHKLIHSGEKPELCSYCGKCYRLKTTLATHIRINHTLETPFTCKVCGEKFLCRDRLIRHRKKFHPEKLKRKPKDKKSSNALTENSKDCDSSAGAHQSTYSTVVNLETQHFPQTTLSYNSNNVSQTDWSFLML